MKCLLVDDHALIRDALGMLIRRHHPQVELICVGRLSEALAQLEADPEIALVLLDLILPDSQGAGTVQAVCGRAGEPRVIVLSADDHPDTVMAALTAGAASFIPKRADFAVLDEALRTILAGGVVLPPTVQAPETSRPGRPPDSGDDLGQLLTQRQIDVFRLLVEGKSNKLIARELALSESTVKTHIQAIFERLDISTRAQAVVVAARRGWPLPPGPAGR